MIKIKRVYEDYGDDDGYRVLVDKLWPRGMKKERLKLDMWNKNITPSTELRKWYHEDKENRWLEFTTRYRLELSRSEAVEDFMKDISAYSTVTLLYAAKDEVHNHAIILKSYLDNKLGTDVIIQTK